MRGKNITSKGGQVRTGEAVFPGMDRDLTKVTLKLRAVGGAGVSLVDTWVKRGPGRQRGKGKGSEVEMSLVCWKQQGPGQPA